MNIIEKLVQSINYRNFDATVELFHDACTVRDHIQDKEKTFQGKAGVRSWLEHLETDATFTFENMLMNREQATAEFSYIDTMTKKGKLKLLLEAGKIKELTIL
ncbi:MAG: hypothetical protein A3B74_02215 [Candidatus Kerfeldbacteria bacterium RIFCSPHIGHO2_02_FULL_42_14]|uniref:SnoaL-like domain-containing protein n=1 Tax=Candidatus Kerfeldbacteria bacterium RIFCSPHIGHO2_02_FULL_42_14 TaxID=1798540 RepID=A0A1G2AU67_9BACT|nr:MAG: hypothetical protein A3B74_02215 [Candidatus Kerfeldbacteria bacterium RIFCSPHIGHO2_02_FULL_42_14]OGY80364.1 MAG: hypothetical protein A3E60_04835 [Candidatus Kerfeldbacteria bacterium RIFCSPHIGHO2_12_FULL_42_13]OGY83793.1 MAG: hypothetical protein A3I91_04360 [Candidatus Kerfeldbacteria bacterium RIFCSPLOWO2_02_FULL_42_19]OGY87140.1 MAG: hypothetical protein A3G01_04650 [Candidatus Kerfeldbacteria bacterium RIFCSPLOWO2_12_FULL_43_9]